jgi:MoaA/NifB/PqqE/SkfB family radical SAM enzyme
MELSRRGFFKKTPFFNRYPRLDWLQVEISSCCGAECIYCPRHVYRKSWISRLMDGDVYERLRPVFQKTRLVYLQGWGEPFTHPDFFKFAQIAKNSGAGVGTTTNGTLIDRQTADQIVSIGMDVICFSLAGLDEKNDAVRKGAPLAKVLSAIEYIHQSKDRQKTDRPKIHIAYMLLRSGLRDLKKLPGFVSEIGADQTVVSSLSLVPGKELLQESMPVESEEEWPERKQLFLDARSRAASLGTDIHFHIAAPFFKRRVCSENVSRALVIGSDGSVSPCVMKNLPVNGNIEYYFSSRKTGYRPLAFGNLQKDPLDVIWHRDAYRHFRKKSLRYLMKPCAACYKQFIHPIEPPDSYWI